jgi:hypothetical protein
MSITLKKGKITRQNAEFTVFGITGVQDGFYG